MRAALALAASAALVGGVVALFTIDNDAGSSLLLAVGVLLGLIAVLGRRLELESFELLGAKLKVREVVKSRVALAQGDEALALQELYDLYEFVRRTEPASKERTGTFDRLVLRMRAAGTQLRFDRAEVVGWFEEGTDPLRLIAIAVMQARDDCRYFPVVLKALERPHSRMERYQALKLAEEMIGSLDKLERRLLRTAIERARRRPGLFRRDEPFMRSSERVLAELRPRSRAAASADASSRS
jgi:hypothetical protein